LCFLQQLAKHQALFDDAHRAWLQEVVTLVLPRRVAACERALRAMGFATALPPPPPPPPRFVPTPRPPWQQQQEKGAAAAAAALQSKAKSKNGDEGEDEEDDKGRHIVVAQTENGEDDDDDDDGEDTAATRAEDAADLGAALPPLPLGPHWSAVDVARAVRRRLPSQAMLAKEQRCVAAALRSVDCHGAAV
jgi:hypothetical protein